MTLKGGFLLFINTSLEKGCFNQSEGMNAEAPRGKNALIASPTRFRMCSRKDAVPPALNKTKQSEGQKVESPRLPNQENNPYYRISGCKHEDRRPEALETGGLHVLPCG